MPVKNKERSNASLSLLIFILSVIAALIPFLLEADMERWGFGVVMVSGVTGLTSLVVFLMFNGRARVWDSMFNKENILAHWSYSEEFWDKVSAADAKDAGIGRIIGSILGGIFLLTGIVVYAAGNDEDGIFMMIMSGIAVFFVVIGFISAAAEKKRVRNSIPEVIIARQGIFFKNTLYTWNNKAISYLESVSMHPAEPSTLLFVLRQLSGARGHAFHFHQYQIPVPIPSGQQQSADELIRYFDLPMADKADE
jgi:hypothetical protein